MPNVEINNECIKKTFMTSFLLAPSDLKIPTEFVLSRTIIKRVPIILKTATKIINPSIIGIGSFEDHPCKIILVDLKTERFIKRLSLFIL
jgi:hypothetical protein